MAHQIPAGIYILIDAAYLNLDNFITPDIDNLEWSPPHNILKYINNYPIYFFATAYGCANGSIIKKNKQVGSIDCDYGILALIPNNFILDLLSENKISDFTNYAIQKSGHIFNFKKPINITQINIGHISFGFYQINTSLNKPAGGPNQRFSRNLTNYLILGMEYKKNLFIK